MSRLKVYGMHTCAAQTIQVHKTTALNQTKLSDDGTDFLE